MRLKICNSMHRIHVIECELAVAVSLQNRQFNAKAIKSEDARPTIQNFKANSMHIIRG
jgi:hypothetical protein